MFDFFWKIIIGIVGMFYKLVYFGYQIFLVLAKTTIFGQGDYQKIVEKVYIILGVVMLFILAYYFLTYIIDPDKDKGGEETFNFLKKVVISFIAVVMCPTIFSFAYKVQTAVLEGGVIEKIFSDTSSGNIKTASSPKEGAAVFAGSMWNLFFRASNDSKDNSGEDQSNGSGWVNEDMDCSDYGSGNYGGGHCYLDEIRDYVDDTGEFFAYKMFADNVEDERIQFEWLISLVAAIYLLWVIVSFCFDLAVRIVKLAFYQIIAPFCIMIGIVPGKEGITKNWTSAVVKTFLASFIRVFIMTLAVYLISLFVNSSDSLWDEMCANDSCSSSLVKVFGNAFIILGLVTFIKQAPKLLEEIFGLGDVSLGIRDKFKEGGGFLAGAAIGGATTGLVRNGVNAVRNVKNNWKKPSDAQGAKAKAKAMLSNSWAVTRGLGSTIAGGTSGLYNAGKAGGKADSWQAVKNAASEGANAATEARDERAAKWARRMAEGENYSNELRDKFIEKEQKLLEDKGMSSTAARLEASHRADLKYPKSSDETRNTFRKIFSPAFDKASDAKLWANGGVEALKLQIERADNYSSMKKEAKIQSEEMVDKLSNSIKIANLFNQNDNGKEMKEAASEHGISDERLKEIKDLSLAGISNYIDEFKKRPQKSAADFKEIDNLENYLKAMTKMAAKQIQSAAFNGEINVAGVKLDEKDMQDLKNSLGKINEELKKDGIRNQQTFEEMSNTLDSIDDQRRKDVAQYQKIQERAKNEGK